MRIEELVIEGFKSYPVRTQIVGWDPSFNAITGLNGSGKSNILDAICFVLGITNMSQMRASNQQDLIYKRGQAGITKASVTIVFDNSDRANSPIALPNISKYILNGHKAPQANVQTFFQSVQLNINNPNFVIMQGRITKVLNMRPQEILGMVEEAAGTRMFEDRKDKAKKTMDKKNKQVGEIKRILAEEVKPKLDKLRAEKRAYVQYQKATSELERIGRTLRAYEWTEFGERAAKKQHEINAKKAAGQLASAEKDVIKVTKKRDEELSKGGKVKALQLEISELGKKLAKEKAQAEIKVDSIKQEETKIGQLEAQVQVVRRIRYRQEAERGGQSQDCLNKVNDKQASLTTKLASDEELLQTLLTGLSSNGAKNKGGGYMGQLADARARIAQAAAEEEQSKVKLGMSEKELADLEGACALCEGGGDNLKKLENLKAAVEALEGKVAGSGWNAEKEKELDMQLRQAREEVKNLTEVKGVAVQLISLPEEHYNKAVALEIAGGGKLFNVVIEDEKVGKDLIKNGRMRKRVTFIPLTKINAWTLSDHTSPEGDNYIFTDTLICDDAETAKKVTFARDVGVRSVTLDGDVYDPSGTLSGGAAPSSTKVLIQVQELLEVESRLREAQNRLQGLGQAEEKARGARERWPRLKLLQEQVEGSNASLIDELKASITAQKHALQKHTVIVKTQQKELQSVTLELEAKEGIAEMRKELEALQRQVAATESRGEAGEEMATLSRFDMELKELDRKIEQDIQILTKEKQTAVANVARHEQLYPWIAEEKEWQYRANALRQKCNELEAAQEGMKKKVNPKVMNMIEGVEKKETDLKKNMATIEETIEELDRYKRDALQKTWEKVSTDFGGIFAELLPGNFAKLQPPEGQDLMDGLEVKVRLGTVWKQSLTELSGGQRSLIALSLIMALLQFKPAPMYILDEIDAALDLSHTQHIGQLFARGSKAPSLFTNANVLFRARFRDGTSIVEDCAEINFLTVCGRR
ncbi:condensin complex subunit SMC2 [Pholiota molesta]|nr:condensin complex subunit SMC2 [Pholiota molesta]